MIQEVKISNFKSVQDLTIPLSRFNVFIGSNGSGKSNILEAIAFGAAAAADKLDNEFLGSRGIRTSDARLMKSAFTSEGYRNEIKISFKTDPNDVSYTIEEKEKPILKWRVKETEAIEIELSTLTKAIIHNDFSELERSRLVNDSAKEPIKKMAEKLKRVNIDSQAQHDDLKAYISKLHKVSAYHNFFLVAGPDISEFIIYSPEVSALRKFEEESQITPLGIKGEGLFNVLQIFNESYEKETINELKDYLHIIEWFDDFEAATDKITGRKSLVVKDRFLPDVALNQQNVNEGFLFLLFYISLIVSNETPFFFAIDNIEASFHPRLCEELTKRMVSLCKKHGKQIILTTHNPAVLDGLDLNDPEQSLFVIRRNADGETIADKIDKQPKNVKLSEAWERGYIGGQPETIE